MPEADLALIRTDMSRILSCSVSQTLAVTDLSGMLMRGKPDLKKIELAAQRLAQAANTTRMVAQDMLFVAQELQKGA